MECLDSAIQNLGKACEIGDLHHRNARTLQYLSGLAGANETEVWRDLSAELNNPCLVKDTDYSLSFLQVTTPSDVAGSDSINRRMQWA